jgi:hypothetical protein
MLHLFACAALYLQVLYGRKALKLNRPRANLAPYRLRSCSRCWWVKRCITTQTMAVRVRLISIAYSHCAGGAGSGKYEIGELGTKGEKEGKIAPRYCVFYTQQGLDTYCTAMYLDEAGVYWQHARRQKIKKIE